MSGNPTISLNQKVLALLSLVAWVIASHACLLAEAGVTFDLGAFSHHAPSTDADEEPQNGSDKDCCEELASVWTSGERVLANAAFSCWNACGAAFGSFRSAPLTADPDPPDIWPPGGRFFASQFVGSSLFGRAPPVIG